MRRYFNTSGPNIPAEHYTIRRENLIQKGLDLVRSRRYFTIWAPRQTGKSTYFRQLAEVLQTEGYKVAHINFENFKTTPVEVFLYELTKKIRDFCGLDYTHATDIAQLFGLISEVKDQKFVLIIDEVEGINPEYFGTFLHSIRNAYHSRESHALKSVILVGVANITGVIGDNASPFNIADNLNVPYFTDAEVYELLGQHEAETGQLFEQAVKDKIIQITACQPALVNDFAQILSMDYAGKPVIEYKDYLKAESWLVHVAIDGSLANIIHYARQEHHLLEKMLFTEEKIPFNITRPFVRFLHINGVFKEDCEGNFAFWIPFYKKRLYKAFYPYTNGEKQRIERNMHVNDFFHQDGSLNVERLITDYKNFVAKRGFAPFREKDENGKFVSIKEAAMIYSFETYISAFITQANGRIYREALAGLGRADMIIHLNQQEYLFEVKNYYAFRQFMEGKKQLAYYALSGQHLKAYYIVFCPNDINYPDKVAEKTETIEGVELITYLIAYDIKAAWKHLAADDEE